MTISDYRNILKSIKDKPGKIKKYEKHNVPKQRHTGFTKQKCKVCLRSQALVGKYGLGLCRHCFRENALNLGFKKFS
jgi:ribosomal protein S14